MSLIALVYVSSESAPTSDAELQAILEVSRINNTSKEITGMLLYRDGFFMQVLEGEEAQVDEVYAAICTDPRHDHILLVYKTPIMQRSFPSWSMGFNKVEDADLQVKPELNDYLVGGHGMEFFAKSPSRATTLLEVFKNQTYF
ncbi:MAG: BLUF domain-containing protein [Armatimonadetes bacterium]|nr:BLUF domain-containing protein [Anaerolineae bacterium]